MLSLQETMEEYMYERIAYLAQKYPVRRLCCCTPVNVYYKNYRFRKSWYGRSIVYSVAAISLLNIVGTIMVMILLNDDRIKHNVYIGTYVCLGLAILIVSVYQWMFMHYAFADAMRIFIDEYALPMWFVELAKSHDEMTEAERSDKLLLQSIIAYYFDRRPFQDRLHWANKAWRVYESTPSV